MSEPTGRPFRVIALIAAYNEEDVVDAVIADLARQRIAVYFIDNHSTDATAERARSWLGRGVIGVESFPAEAPDHYPWADLLHRKEELASSLEADWFIHQDADEFRESPWQGVDLLDAIALVDRQGYNAIDFEVFDFWPTNNDFVPGRDVRDYLKHCTPAAEFDRLRVNCWKRLPEVRVDLASQGGHDASFPQRRVFPIRFLLRHYPIRSQEHGERKIFAERAPRFLPEEKAIGWHRQYEASGHSHLRSPADLVLYDGETARLRSQIENRRVDALHREIEALRSELEDDRAARSGTPDELAARLAESQGALRRMTRARDAYAEEVERRGAAITAFEEAVKELTTSRDIHAREAERRGLALAAERARLAEVLASRSWRWGAPVRRILAPFFLSARAARPRAKR